VRLALCGAQTSLPAGVDLSAYRIVQEALTNTLKHAGAGAQASVRLTIGPECVDIEVTTTAPVDPLAGPPSMATDCGASPNG
jgi:signal transduction histidine kinase